MRNVLGVGWDVGGWIGRKQGVAVASADAAGVQWLGRARAFCLADFDSPGWSLLDLIQQAWPEAPLDTIENYRVILAIDAPLGFPIAFKQLLETGEAPPFPPNGAEIGNPLAYRDCDRHIFKTFNKKPLSASFDKLGNNATVAMHHARRLSRLHSARLIPFDSLSTTDHTILEVYPALAKVPRQTSCYARIQTLLPPDSNAGTDECDACICALMAMAFGAREACRLPPLVEPNSQQIHTARLEGWIYYPDPAGLRC